MSAEPARRDFLKTTVAAGATLALGTAAGGLPAVHAASNETIRVGLIGAGGRGSGAARDVMNSAPNVELYAVADIWPDKLKNFMSGLKKVAEDGKAKEFGNRINLPEERQFL